MGRKKKIKKTTTTLDLCQSIFSVNPQINVLYVIGGNIFYTQNSAMAFYNSSKSTTEIKIVNRNK